MYRLLYYTQFPVISEPALSVAEGNEMKTRRPW